MSTAKFSDAGYTSIFDGDQGNIYNQHDTVIMVSHAAIIRGWQEPGTNELFRIPLVPVVRNNNTKTILVKPPPSEYLPTRPPPQEAVFNAYELKTHPELVQYLHASAGFATNAWPGLTPEAIAKHFPESEETLNGHAQKTKSGRRSTNGTQDGKVTSSTNTMPTPKQKSPAQQHKGATFLSKSTTSKRTKPS